MSARSVLVSLGVLGLLVAAVLLRSPADPPETLPFYRSADLTPEWLTAGEAASDGMHRAGAFAFENQHAEVVTEAALVGRIAVVNFFFTQCTGICPTTRANLARLREEFAGEDGLVLASFSVMPEMDSHEVLHTYAEAHDLPVGWHLLTGTESEIRRVASDDYFVNLADGTAYGVDDLQHTENVVLLDAHRRIRGVYAGTLRLDMERLADDIRVLLGEIAAHDHARHDDARHDDARHDAATHDAATHGTEDAGRDGVSGPDPDLGSKRVGRARAKPTR